MLGNVATRPPWFNWLAPVLSLLLFSCSLKLHSADVEVAQEVTDLGPDVRTLLPVVINAGAEFFNNGDPEAACRVYESGLRVLRPALAGRPRLQQMIDDALADAGRMPDARDRAFALRPVFDALKAELKPRLVADTPKPPRAADTPKPTVGFTMTRDEQAIVDLMNAERKKADLPALRPNEKLFEAARSHTANMARQEVLAHVLENEHPGDRLRKVGYRASTWGENCAAGQHTPEEAISGWMNSDGHRKNLLGAQYTEIGVGIAVSGTGTRYWTQVFATPAGQRVGAK